MSGQMGTHDAPPEAGMTDGDRAFMRDGVPAELLVNVGRTVPTV
ncbi:hypothetical protein ACFYNM_38775 [Streptomyces spororaveus]